MSNFETKFPQAVLVKLSVWNGIEAFLLKNPDKSKQLFKIDQEFFQYYPVGYKLFLCLSSIDKPVAIVQIISVEQKCDKTEPKTTVVVRVVLQLRRSQIMNLEEVFKHLL